jgi:hypothetical protein
MTWATRTCELDTGEPQGGARVPNENDFLLTCFGPPRRMEQWRAWSIIAALTVKGHSRGNPPRLGDLGSFSYIYLSEYLMAATMDSLAFQKVGDFERAPEDTGTSWLNPGWLYIKKKDVVDGLKDRLASPGHIDTSNLNLCGPGLFFYFLAQDEPATYAQIVIDLFSKRKALLGSRKITAPNDLVISPLTKGADTIPHVGVVSMVRPSSCTSILHES